MAWRKSTAEVFEGVLPKEDIDRLERSNQRDRITELQQKMRNVGYDVAVDGVWGPQTERAYNDYAPKSQTVLRGTERLKADSSTTQKVSNFLHNDTGLLNVAAKFLPDGIGNTIRNVNSGISDVFVNQIPKGAATMSALASGAVNDSIANYADVIGAKRVSDWARDNKRQAAEGLATVEDYLPSPETLGPQVDYQGLSSLTDPRWLQSQGARLAGNLAGQVGSSVIGGLGITKGMSGLVNGVRAARAAEGLAGGSRMGNALISGADTINALDNGGKFAQFAGRAVKAAPFTVFDQVQDSALEAESVFAEARGMGMDPEKALNASKQVFKDNLIANAGLGIGEALIAGAGGRAIGKLGSIGSGVVKAAGVGGLEGLQEGLQTNLERKALGKPYTYNPIEWAQDPESQLGMIAGFAAGAPMGAVGHIAANAHEQYANEQKFVRDEFAAHINAMDNPQPVESVNGNPLINSMRRGAGLPPLEAATNAQNVTPIERVSEPQGIMSAEDYNAFSPLVDPAYQPKAEAVAPDVAGQVQEGAKFSIGDNQGSLDVLLAAPEFSSWNNKRKAGISKFTPEEVANQNAIRKVSDDVISSRLGNGDSYTDVLNSVHPIVRNAEIDRFKFTPNDDSNTTALDGLSLNEQRNEAVKFVSESIDNKSEIHTKDGDIIRFQPHNQKPEEYVDHLIKGKDGKEVKPERVRALFLIRETLEKPDAIIKQPKNVNNGNKVYVSLYKDNKGLLHEIAVETSGNIVTQFATTGIIGDVKKAHRYFRSVLKNSEKIIYLRDGLSGHSRPPSGVQASKQNAPLSLSGNLRNSVSQTSNNIKQSLGTININGTPVNVVAGNVRPEIKEFLNRVGSGAVFVDMDPSINGFYHNGMAHINVNSPRAMDWVAGHEVTHFIEERSPELLRELGSALKLTMTDVREKVNTYAAKGINLSVTGAISELIADKVGQHWASPEFWAKYKQQKPSLWQKVVRAIRLFVRKFYSKAEVAEIEKNGLSPDALIRAMSAMETQKATESTNMKASLNQDVIRAQQELAEVRAKYENTPQWMMAPNGKPTKLTEQQWLQVRTPSFIKWFGDWRIMAKTPEITELALKGWSENKITALARAVYGNILQGREVFNNDTKNNIAFTAEGKGEAFAGIKETIDAEVVNALAELVEKSVKVNETTPDERRKHDTKAFEVYVAPLIIGDSTYTVKITVRNSLMNPTGRASRKFYDVSIIKESPLGHGVVAKIGNSSVSPELSIKISVAQLLTVFKGENEKHIPRASKVVDENGEPLMVYHGTGKAFNVFDKSKLGSRESAFFFTSNKKDADNYGSVSIPVFLNVRRLADLDEDYHDVRSGENVDINKASEQFDGYVTDRNESWNEWAVYDQHNIKSATDNIGTFDINNPDIRFSLNNEVEESNKPRSNPARAVGSEAKGLLVSAKDGMVDAIESSRDFFTPHSSSKQGALQTGQSLREQLSRAAQAGDQATAALKKSRDAMNKLSKDAQWELVRKFEAGEPLGPEWTPVFNIISVALENRRKKLQSFGLLKNYIELYVPHQWKNTKVARQVFKRMKANPAANDGFLQKRVLSSYAKGIEFGLEPKFDNPIDNFMFAMQQMDRMIAVRTVLDELKGAGLLKHFNFKQPNKPELLDTENLTAGMTIGQANLINAGMEKKYRDAKAEYDKKAEEFELPDGWGRLSDSFNIDGLGKSIYCPEGVALILNNFVSTGFEGNKLYEGLRWFSNLMNSLQLSMSMFHFFFTTMDAGTSTAQVGMREMRRGLITGNPKMFVKGMLNTTYGIALTPAAGIHNLVRGNKVMKAWLANDVTDPALREIIEGVCLAGGRAKMDNFYHMGAVQSVKDAFKNDKFLKGLGNTIPALVELSVKPVLEYAVPRQKMGVFAMMYAKELELFPDMSYAEKRTKAQEIWDSVDNRLGQLVYDNLFWQKGLKQALMLSMRSVGWNLGSVREIGGGLSDMVYGNIKNKQVSQRSEYVVAALAVNLMWVSVLTYMLTGALPDMPDEYPEDASTWDKFWMAAKPLMFAKDAQGKYYSLPTYVKDMYHWFTAPAETAVNKLNPMWSFIGQLARNYDYFGTEIRDKDDEWYKQAADVGKFVGQQFLPFNVRNVIKGYDEGDAMTPILSQLGITPAPSSVAKSPAEQKAFEFQQLNYSGGVTSQDDRAKYDLRKKLIKSVERQGDQSEELKQAYASGRIDLKTMEDVLRIGKMPKLARAVAKLTGPQIEEVMRSANSQERAILEPIFAKKTEVPIKEQLMKKVVEGDRNAVVKAVRAKQITAQQGTAILKESRLPAFTREIMNKSPEKLVELINVVPLDQRKQVISVLRQKIRTPKNLEWFKTLPANTQRIIQGG